MSRQIGERHGLRVLRDGPSEASEQVIEQAVLACQRRLALGRLDQRLQSLAMSGIKRPHGVEPESGLIDGLAEIGLRWAKKDSRSGRCESCANWLAHS